MSGIYIEKKVLKDFYEKIININKEDFLNSKFDDIILDIFNKLKNLGIKNIIIVI